MSIGKRIITDRYARASKESSIFSWQIKCHTAFSAYTYNTILQDHCESSNI